MKRMIFAKLKQWKDSKDRKPLLLNGARQVGKTHILQAFGRAAYQDMLYLNFEDTPALKRLFEDSLDPDVLITAIRLRFSKPIRPGKTLIIFDEVQECPNALNSLKYFQENAGEYHVCAAGSLLGVKLAHTRGFPVGKVNFLHLHPLSFLEFLDALGESALYEYLRDIKKIAPLSTLVHEKLIGLLKIYFFTGGLPEPVLRYKQSREFDIVRIVQESILKAYRLDFAKHTTAATSMKIAQVWQTIPNQLAKENKKFVYSLIRQSARAREYIDAIQWLDEAGLIYKIYNVSAPKFPIKAYADRQVFKTYVVDVGLLNAMANLPAKLIIEGNALFREFKGSLTENYVVEALASHFDEQYYWTSEGRAEIDGVFQCDQHILPVEIKASNSGKKRSLHVYQQKYHPKLLIRISPNNLKLDGNILNCPLYLVDQLPKFCTQLI